MKKSVSATPDLGRKKRAPLVTPTDLKVAATRDIAGAMNAILADVFALYLKTKNFHWHMSGPHFRDYHLLFDEQADQLYAMTDPIAERIRKVGGTTLYVDQESQVRALDCSALSALADSVFGRYGGDGDTSPRPDRTGSGKARSQSP